MKVSKIKYDELNNDIINTILYKGLEDKGDVADCAMVLGSNKAPKYRVPLAVSLYEQKRFPKVLLCGGTLRDTAQGRMTEAEIMKRKAVELGVPQEDILMEELSRTTKENMLCALLPLEREFKLSNVKK